MAVATVCFQRLPIDFAFLGDMLGQIDGTQTAVFVGAKPLFAAGVGRFQLVQMRNRIGAVGGIEEKHARLAIAVGIGGDLVEQIAGVVPSAIPCPCAG